MFENLMKYAQTDEHPADDPNMYMTEVVPGQAASYTVSDDGLVYTFTLSPLPQMTGSTPGEDWSTPTPRLTTATSWTASL